LRLPLDSISWHPPRRTFEADPHAVSGPLPDGAGSDEAVVDETPDAPITALVAEVREDVLYVFLPPTDALEHFIDLVARVEDAAAAIGCPVVVEGYGPPPDPRLEFASITPDPGVIEVNLAPSASFAEQSAQLRTLYDRARLARLSTESFDLDGTLVDTAPYLMGTLNTILADQGLATLPMEAARNLIGKGAKALLERGFTASGRSLDAEQSDRLFQQFLDIYLSRIAQEAIQNAIKHGDATQIRVDLDLLQGILSITDNGNGIKDDDPAPARGNGMGLKIMRHRADAIHGTVAVERIPKGGVRVTCHFPK
jgi:hypothetical protein